MTKPATRLPATKVSVVVPAYNEERNIVRLLRSLLAQKLELTRILEIVVVASGCTDRTVEEARSVAKESGFIRIHVQEERRGKVAAINSYLRTRDPRADVIVLCSADLEVAPDVVEKIASTMRNHSAVGMVGARPVPDNGREGLVNAMVHVVWELHHRVSLLTPKMGELVAFRAGLVDSVSELSVVDEASIENIVREKGYSLGYLGDAIVTNHGPETFSEFLEQRRRIARGHYWLEFAFGYRVATLDQRMVSRLVLDYFFDSKTSVERVALGAAIATEAAARVLGFWDARVVGGRHRTWVQASTTKALKPERKAS